VESSCRFIAYDYFISITPHAEELQRTAMVSWRARSPRNCSCTDEPQDFLQQSPDKIDHSLKQCFLASDVQSNGRPPAVFQCPHWAAATKCNNCAC